MSGQPVVVFGIGSFAEIVPYYLQNDSPHTVVAFTVNRDYIQDTTLHGINVVPFEDLSNAFPPGEVKILIAVGPSGMNTNRQRIYETCKAQGYEFISYISSRATIWDDLEVGDNTFIFEDNTIQPFTKIGANTVLWSGNHVGYHSTIGDHCFVTSHTVISGNCNIGNNTFIGVNATIIDGITVGESTLIGAGALIVRNTEPHSSYIGQRTKPSGKPSSAFKL